MTLPLHLDSHSTGTGPTGTSSKKKLQIKRDVRHRTTVWVRECGCPPKIYTSRLLPRSWLLGFVGPFPITRLIGPAAVRLRMPRSLRVHQSFHVSQVKPVKESTIVPCPRCQSISFVLSSTSSLVHSLVHRLVCFQVKYCQVLFSV